jgi:hypothetical protein
VLWVGDHVEVALRGGHGRAALRVGEERLY